MAQTYPPTRMDAFRQNILDAFPGVGATWLAQLPGLIKEFEQRWSIRTLDPFLLSFSFCAPAIHSSGHEVVLKLAVPCKDFTHQVHALRAFNGHGMARILEADIERGAILMERLLPGKMLVEEVSGDDLATSIAAELMLKMWVPPPADYAFPTTAYWASSFAQIRSHFSGRASPMPVTTIDRTIALFSELHRDPHPPFLLHGDLHHFNILSVIEGETSGWRAIDPFGVIGEREADIGALIKNPDLSLPIGPELARLLNRRFDILHEHLGFDRQRMITWASVYAALSAWWTLSVDAGGWEFDVALSDFLAGLL